MQYFGLPNTDPDAGNLFGVAVGDSCLPADYAMPAIEICAAAGRRRARSRRRSRRTRMPNTATPTPPALQGAIDHATDWAKAHPQDVTIVILATDGDPSECGDTSTNSLLQQVENIAAAGVAQTPKILTFVIGVGTETANLNGIAMAGGTGSAFIVDTSQNVSQQFLTALNKIRGAALGCQYKIPDTPGRRQRRTSSKVNVQFTPARRQAHRRAVRVGQEQVPVVGQRLVLRQRVEPDRDPPLHDDVRHGQRGRRARRAHRLPDASTCPPSRPAPAQPRARYFLSAA